MKCESKALQRDYLILLFIRIFFPLFFPFEGKEEEEEIYFIHRPKRMLVKFGRKREGGRGSSLLYCVRPDCMTKHKARTVFLPSTQLERITRPVILFSLRLPWLFFFLLKIFDLTYIPFLQQNNIGNGSLTLYS